MVSEPNQTLAAYHVATSRARLLRDVITIVLPKGMRRLLQRLLMVPKGGFVRANYGNSANEVGFLCFSLTLATPAM